MSAAARITVWTGTLVAAAATDAADLDPADFSSRAIVHFTRWNDVTAYYHGTAFAPLIEALRSRVLAFSTLSPPSGPIRGDR